jgi:hypothetical protein
MPGQNFTPQQAKKALWSTHAVWLMTLQDELNIFL